MHCSQAWDGIEPTFLTGELRMEQKLNDSINTRVPVVPLVFLYEDIRFWSHDRRILDLVNKQLRSRKLRGRRGVSAHETGKQCVQQFSRHAIVCWWRSTNLDDALLPTVHHEPRNWNSGILHPEWNGPNCNYIAFNYATSSWENTSLRAEKKRVEILTWAFFFEAFFRGRKEDSAQIVCGN